tara:strand:+ start:375 stop:1142 length:768 start_codon:yes stop_codon:yes gene_type:complete
MWFLQIIALGVFLFVVFGIICYLLGYNDELNFEPDDQDMIYPMLVASIFGFLFPGMGFFLYMDSKLSILISSLIAIFSSIILLFFKKDKGSQEISDEKKSRNKKYLKKLKELTSGGWLVGDIPNSYGSSKIITSPFGKKTRLYKLSLNSKFDSYQMIKFIKSNWISFTEKSLENIYGTPRFNETSLFEFFVVVPELVKGAIIYYDYNDGLFHNELDQKVFKGDFETSNNCSVEVRNGKIVKIEKNIWIAKAKNVI